MSPSTIFGVCITKRSQTFAVHSEVIFRRGNFVTNFVISCQRSKICMFLDARVRMWICGFMDSCFVSCSMTFLKNCVALIKKILTSSSGPCSQLVSKNVEIILEMRRNLQDFALQIMEYGLDYSTVLAQNLLKIAFAVFVLKFACIGKNNSTNYFGQIVHQYTAWISHRYFIEDYKAQSVLPAGEHVVTWIWLEVYSAMELRQKRAVL